MPSLSFASSLCATGFGDVSYNGTYTENSTYSGQPVYTNFSKFLYSFSGNPTGEFLLSASTGEEGAGIAYYIVNTSPVGTWTTYTAGTDPAGDVALNECVAPTSTPPFATGTTTDTILYGDFMVVSAIIVFLISFITWSFFFSPFNKKR